MHWVYYVVTWYIEHIRRLLHLVGMKLAICDKMPIGGLLTGELLRYVKQDSEMGAFFRRGPTFGEHGWAFLS